MDVGNSLWKATENRFQSRYASDLYSEAPIVDFFPVLTERFRGFPQFFRASTSMMTHAMTTYFCTFSNSLFTNYKVVQIWPGLICV